MPLYHNSGGSLMHLPWGPLMNACCCNSYDFKATLNWSNNADLDLYVMGDWRDPVNHGTDWAHIYCYYDWTRMYAPNYEFSMRLNGDARPRCSTLEQYAPPEIITARGISKEHWFSTWYSQYSSCEDETLATLAEVEIHNTGLGPIWVNGNEVDPDAYYTEEIWYNGYDLGRDTGGPPGTPPPIGVDGEPKGTTLYVTFTAP